MNGLDATRQILEDLPETAVLMLSMHSENTWVRQAIDAGAKGYILKNAMNLELGPAMRRVAREKLFLIRRSSSNRLSKANAAAALLRASLKSCG